MTDPSKTDRSLHQLVLLQQNAWQFCTCIPPAIRWSIKQTYHSPIIHPTHFKNLRASLTLLSDVVVLSRLSETTAATCLQHMPDLLPFWPGLFRHGLGVYEARLLIYMRRVLLHKDAHNCTLAHANMQTYRQKSPVNPTSYKMASLQGRIHTEYWISFH